MENYTKRAFSGTFIVLTLTLLAAIIGYFVRFALARNLTVYDYGLFYSVFSFLGLLGIFKSLGFDRSLGKFLPEFLHKNNIDLIKSSIVYLSLVQLITNTIVILGIYFFSKYLALNFFHDPSSIILLKLMAIAFFIDNFAMNLKFIFQGFQKMGLYASLDFVRMVLILIFIHIGFKLNLHILSPVYAYIIVPILLIIVFYFIFIKYVFKKFKFAKLIFDKQEFKRISKYSLLTMIVSVAGMVLGYTDIMMLTYFSGLTSVGLYSVALPTANILTYFPKALEGVLLPLTSELWIKNKLAILKEGILALYKYSLIIILPPTLILISFSDILIKYLFGVEYLEAQNALKILSFGMIFATMSSTNLHFFFGMGKPEINTKIVYTAAIFNLILNIILIPKIGIIGAALTTLLGYIIMMVMGFNKIKKILKIKLPIVIWIKIIFNGVIFISVIFFIKNIINLNIWIEVFLSLFFAFLIYIIFLFILKIITLNEIKGIYDRIAK